MYLSTWQWPVVLALAAAAVVLYRLPLPLPHTSDQVVVIWSIRAKPPREPRAALRQLPYCRRPGSGDDDCDCLSLSRYSGSRCCQASSHTRVIPSYVPGVRGRGGDLRNVAARRNRLPLFWKSSKGAQSAEGEAFPL
ncbi:hypothetical protein PG985_016003 [Apiospora marii]|uniref:uncharacterized protein n=1 Tax=Apiospora marii TaxID=335849 RepID=UPI00312F3E11